MPESLARMWALLDWADEPCDTGQALQPQSHLFTFELVCAEGLEGCLLLIMSVQNQQGSESDLTGHSVSVSWQSQL